MTPRKSSLPLAVLAVLAIPAHADDVNCPPNLGAVTIDGNVLVAAACRLDGTTVKGNVLLYSGGSLVARNVNVIGNIQAERANFVDVDQSRVNGDVQLDELVGDLSRVQRTAVGGSIQLVANRSRLEVLDNEVGADVQTFSNTGGVVIADNSIDGNLQCKSNVPAPAGGNNVVQGNKEDQCADLRPEAGSNPAPGPVSPGSATAGSGGSGGGGSFGLFGAALALLALCKLGTPARLLRVAGRRAGRGERT